MVLTSFSAGFTLQNTTPIPASMSSEAVLLSIEEVITATPRTSFDQLAQDGFRPGLVVLGVAKKDVEPTIPCGSLESTNDFGEIRVGDLRNHQPEQIAPAGRQPPGMYI